MDSFSNPADFLMDITNGDAVSALVTPSAGTENGIGSGGSPQYKNVKIMLLSEPAAISRTPKITTEAFRLSMRLS